MKKLLKAAGITLAVLAAGAFALLKYLGSRPAAPPDYQQTTETGTQLEAKYLADGGFGVSRYEEPVLQVFKKYIVYYPSELEASGRTYPAIVLCNGSGTPLSKYPTVAKHYASWGFIVIGTEEENAWNGFGAEMCIRHLQRLRDSERLEEGGENIFYQKIDLDRVGIVGHSQGGVGVLNALTAQEHRDVYQAAVSLSPTNQELAHALEWDYRAELVQTPILLLSGEGGGDDWVVTGDQLADIYRGIPAEKAMARRKNTVHNEMLYAADGYVTAWFMWRLQGDGEAARAFTGASPGLLEDPLYQDQQLDLAKE